ncbi:MAG: hypothetical protein ACK4QL_05355 [Pseudanabaenaceae cyanobacterium]
MGELQLVVKPLFLSQPEGGNLKRNGNFFQWRHWSFHVGMDKRVGTVLSLLVMTIAVPFVLFCMKGRCQRCLFPTWIQFRTYFDSGEYGFGMLATSLQRGIGCPDNALTLAMTRATSTRRRR